MYHVGCRREWRNPSNEQVLPPLLYHPPPCPCQVAITFFVFLFIPPISALLAGFLPRVAPICGHKEEGALPEVPQTTPPAVHRRF